MVSLLLSGIVPANSRAASLSLQLDEGKEQTWRERTDKEFGLDTTGRED
jgi:hypothetical protein